MKKGLIILALTLLLTGCGKKDENIIETNTDTLQPETQIEQVEDKQEVVVEPEVKIEEKVELKIDETKQKYAELYAGVLNKYIDVIKNKAKYENIESLSELGEELGIYISEHSGLQRELSEIKLSDICYTTADIDNDTIKELLIFDKDDNVICCSYDIINDKVEMSIRSKYRNYTYLCKDNVLLHSANAGASSNLESYINLPDGSYKSFEWGMNLEEENEGTLWFIITDSNGTRNLTHDEFFAELEELKKKYPKLEKIEKRSLAEPIKLDM